MRSTNQQTRVATLELVKALDEGRKPEEALPVWRKMLDVASSSLNRAH
jgi:hypothetical protein